MDIAQRHDAEPGEGRDLAPTSGAGWQLGGLGALALCIMAPVTLPVPVLREIVQDRFAVSELLTSTFMSINMLGALLAAPLAGALVDRVGRQRMLLASALCLDAACFALLSAPVSFSLFLAIRFVEGCAHITALSILLTLASHALPAAQKGRAMGVVGGCMMLGIALGAPLGGRLGNVGVLLPLQVGAGLALFAALLAALIVRDGGQRDEERPSFARIVGALRAHPRLLVPLAFAFADRFTVGFFTTTFSLYAKRIHELEPQQIGLTITLFMLPFAALSYPFGRLAERYSIAVLLCGGSLLYGVGTMAVGYVAPPELAWLMAGIGVTAAVMFVPSMVLTAEYAPDEIRATAMGGFNMAGSLGFLVGPVTGGLITQAVASSEGWLAGYRAAFLVAGLSELLCVAVALPFMLRLSRTRAA